MPLPTTLDELGQALEHRAAICEIERGLPALQAQCAAAAADKAAVTAGKLPTAYTKGADGALAAECTAQIARLKDSREKLKSLAEGDPIIARATAAIQAIRALRSDIKE
jgi:hypothetical protein